MPSPIVKTANVTVVSYSAIHVVDNVPTLVPMQAVFSGTYPPERVERMLKRRHPDVPFMVTKCENVRHRYVMDFEDFILHARIEDIAESEDSAGEEEEEDAAEAADSDTEASADAED